MIIVGKCCKNIKEKPKKERNREQLTGPIIVACQ